MKTKNHTINTVLGSLLEVLIGILLLVNPISFTSGILIGIGIILCIAGLKSVITYFRLPAQAAAASHALAFGIGGLLAGGFLAFQSQWIILTFPILTVIYGIMILITGLAKLQTAIDILRLKRGRWYLVGISTLLTLACAAIILLNPFSSTAALWMFTGITMIVEAVLDILTLIFGKTKQDTEEPTQA